MKEYKIMSINDGRDVTFGDVIIVRANPIMVNEFSGAKSFITHLNDKTEIFFFPKTERILNNLIWVANNSETWLVDESDFMDKKIRNGNTNNIETIHRHISFYEE